MEKIKLEFISPQILNELKLGDMVEKSYWRYVNIPDSTLFIDTDSWVITTEDNLKTSVISNWSVNEETKEFALTTEVENTDFKKIDYVFALAMLGQLIDKDGLISYLKSLRKAFDIIKPSSNEPDSDKNKEINNNDNH